MSLQQQQQALEEQKQQLELRDSELAQLQAGLEDEKGRLLRQCKTEREEIARKWQELKDEIQRMEEMHTMQKVNGKMVLRKTLYFKRIYMIVWFSMPFNMLIILCFGFADWGGGGSWANKFNFDATVHFHFVHQIPPADEKFNQAVSAVYDSFLLKLKFSVIHIVFVLEFFFSPIDVK